LDGVYREVHRIEKAGHWTPVEPPEALSRIMVDWPTGRLEGREQHAEADDSSRDRKTERPEADASRRF